MTSIVNWTCCIVAMAIARVAFDLPWPAGLVAGFAGYFAPMAFAFLGMKVTGAAIKRTPEGRAMLADHEAEQKEAWRIRDDLRRRQAAGDRVDIAEVERVEGILFRNKGVLGRQGAADSASRPAKALLVPYSTDTGRRGPDWLMSNVDPTLAINFSPSPEDTVWGEINEGNASAYQLWFQRMALKGKLYDLHATDQVTDEIAETMASTVNEAWKTMGLNPALLLWLAYQFVDADQMMRQMHMTTWVAAMVRRENWAPPPESYADHIMGRYFSAHRE